MAMKGQKRSVSQVIALKGPNLSDVQRWGLTPRGTYRFGR